MFFDNLIIHLMVTRDEINSVKCHIIKVLDVLPSIHA
jgi:hypothetical protein